MSIIIDKLLIEPKVYPGYKENMMNKYINIKNLFIPIIVGLIMSFLNISNILIFISIIILFLYISNKNINEENRKIEFLNGIIYNKYEEPFETESYLHMDSDIVNFYYRIRYYIDENLTAYRKSLEHTNNLLRIYYNLKYNLTREPEQLFENAYLEYKEALNNLHSSIYKMISQRVNDDLFNDNLTTLKYLLSKNIKNMKKIIKCDYNLYNLNIWSLPNPSNIECESDIKDKNYSPHYSFY